ncbi:plectin-like [Cajanus cajan]|uniref:plectin-like n=1 Tax=Cajanus cajan TaxID=3821 RepID=UPI00098D940E|nr:plectin-like [Cajanus cajan]
MRFSGSEGLTLSDEEKKDIERLEGLTRPLESKAILLLAGSKNPREDLKSIMVRSKWRELKAKHGEKELEVINVEGAKEKEKLETKKKKQRVGDKNADTSGPKLIQTEVGVGEKDARLSHPTEESGRPVIASVTMPSSSTSDAGHQKGKNPTVVILDEETALKSKEITDSISSDESMSELQKEIAQLGFSSLIPQGGSSQGGQTSRPRSIHQRYDSNHPLERLDHVSMSPDVTSFWSAKLTADAFYKEDRAHIADKALIEKVGPVEGLDSVEVFLQRSIAVVDHWKRRWKKNIEQMDKLKAENVKVGSLCAELNDVKGNFAENNKAFEISLRSNKSYSAKVEELLSKVKKVEEEKEQKEKENAELRAKVKENSEKEKENAELKKKLEEQKRLTSELHEEFQRLREQNKACQEVIAADVEKATDLEKKNNKLSKDLENLELHVMEEHKKGFAKALRQIKIVLQESIFVI